MASKFNTNQIGDGPGTSDEYLNGLGVFTDPLVTAGVAAATLDIWINYYQ